MPRQNRVTPAGDIVAVPQRGTLMGNRGVLHENARIVRPWQVTRWIACATEFRGRWRPVMAPRRWTELFFLDEATALSAGHRPCAQCRHADYQRFRAAFARANGLEAPDADTMDRILHADRLDERRCKRLYQRPLGELPDGAMVELEGGAYLVDGPDLVRWTFSGYTDRFRLEPSDVVDVLTPQSVVRAIAAGYRPATHDSLTGPVADSDEEEISTAPEP
jgi:hypothetical protein